LGEKKICVKGTIEIRACEARSKYARKLALKLLSLFFTKEQLAEGLCTPMKGKNLLNPEIIEGIRYKSLIIGEYQFLSVLQVSAGSEEHRLACYA